MTTTTTTVRPCRQCGGPRQRHTGRGLCARCYRRVRDAGELDQWPLLYRRREDVIATYKSLKVRIHDITNAEIAHELGMTRKALCRALTRARRAGLLEAA